jgi:two-component sensor histidine kinase
MTQTGFMTSFFKRLFSTRLELRERLLELGQDFKFESAAHRISAAMANRELANHLHSSVQNRLLALALMIERGQRVSISDELQAIDQLLANFRQTGPGSLIQELEELRSRWSGIAEVEFEFDPVPTENYEVVLKAVSEAINNSIRHGMATKLAVTVANLEFGYMITVTDDGLGPRNGAKGLGSMYFDSITDGGWALRPLDGGGTQLTLAIPNRVAR